MYEATFRLGERLSGFLTSSDLNDYRPVMQSHDRIQTAVGRSHPQSRLPSHYFITQRFLRGNKSWGYDSENWLAKVTPTSAEFVLFGPAVWFAERVNDHSRLFTSFRNVHTRSPSMIVSFCSLGTTRTDPALGNPRCGSAVRWGDDTWITSSSTAGISFNHRRDLFLPFLLFPLFSDWILLLRQPQWVWL